MIGCKDQCLYHGTHFWWDEDENEFLFCATWKCEKNYPDMPDYWHLEDLELESWNLMTPSKENQLIQEVEQMAQNGGAIWCDVERDGPPFTMKEVDYS